jgi:hypothetical protein
MIDNPNIIVITKHLKQTGAGLEVGERVGVTGDVNNLLTLHHLF